MNFNDIFDRYASLTYTGRFPKESSQDNYRKMLKKYQNKRRKRK